MNTYILDSGLNDLKTDSGKVEQTTSPEYNNSDLDRKKATDENRKDSLSQVSQREDVEICNGAPQALESIRDKILSARKTPDQVAQLIQTKEELLTIPVFKRPPDGTYWRVRHDEVWDPELAEVILLKPTENGSSSEFLLVLPELEELVFSDQRVKNLVGYFFLAFICDHRGQHAWWAVPSRSDNSWHVSARAAMRQLYKKSGMMKSDTSSKGYKLELSTDPIPDPIWKPGSRDDWFVKGFSDKLLDSKDHPALKELQGRIL